MLQQLNLKKRRKAPKLCSLLSLGFQHHIDGSKSLGNSPGARQVEDSSASSSDIRALIIHLIRMIT